MKIAAKLLGPDLQPPGQKRSPLGKHCEEPTVVTTRVQGRGLFHQNVQGDRAGCVGGVQGGGWVLVDREPFNQCE